MQLDYDHVVSVAVKQDAHAKWMAKTRVTTFEKKLVEALATGLESMHVNALAAHSSSAGPLLESSLRFRKSKGEGRGSSFVVSRA